jgi:hypothetical protein
MAFFMYNKLGDSDTTSATPCPVHAPGSRLSQTGPPSGAFLRSAPQDKAEKPTIQQTNRVWVAFIELRFLPY